MDAAEIRLELTAAVAAFKAGRFDEAAEHCTCILAQDGSQTNVLQLLGTALHKARRFAEADPVLQRAAALAPGAASVQFNTAENLAALHRYAEAVPYYEAALRLQPDAIGFNNLGNALETLGRFPAALEAYAACLRLRPDYAPAENNRGIILVALGRLTEAGQAFLAAIRQDARQPIYFQNLGNVLKDLGRHTDAATCYQNALTLQPHSAQAASSLLLCRQYDATWSPAALVEGHRAWGTRLMSRLAPAALPPRAPASADAPLRIGLLSSDLRGHPVTFFLLSLLAARDRARFAYVAFADVPNPDRYTEKVRALLDGWVGTTGLRPAEIAAHVREQGIDVLLDLGGHAGNTPLAVFAWRPAPVQITYLGYPGTTGLPTMDYRLTDALADPPGESESHYTETVLRLPRCAWCYQPPDESPPAAAATTTERPVTFGCFNTSAKWNDPLLQAWGAILAALPAARLKLKNRALGDAHFRAEVTRRLVAAGASAGQLQLLPLTPNLAAHLASYHDVDVALDTFPYHGTTTTTEALWMGVPVVTLVGAGHRARVGVSLLTTVGEPAGITTSWPEYVARALEFARRGPREAAARTALREQVRRSPLLDAAGFARAFEATLTSVARPPVPVTAGRHA